MGLTSRVEAPPASPGRATTEGRLDPRLAFDEHLIAALREAGPPADNDWSRCLRAFVDERFVDHRGAASCTPHLDHATRASALAVHEQQHSRVTSLCVAEVPPGACLDSVRRVPETYPALDWLARRRAGESAALIAKRAGVSEAVVRRDTRAYGPFPRPTQQVRRTTVGGDVLTARTAFRTSW